MTQPLAEVPDKQAFSHSIAVERYGSCDDTGEIQHDTALGDGAMFIWVFCVASLTSTKFQALPDLSDASDPWDRLEGGLQA